MAGIGRICDVVTDMPCRVAGGEETVNLQVTNIDSVSMFDMLSEGTDAIISTKHFEFIAYLFYQLFISPCMVPVSDSLYS